MIGSGTSWNLGSISATVVRKVGILWHWYTLSAVTNRKKDEKNCEKEEIEQHILLNLKGINWFDLYPRYVLAITWVGSGLWLEHNTGEAPASPTTSHHHHHHHHLHDHHHHHHHKHHKQLYYIPTVNCAYWYILAQKVNVQLCQYLPKMTFVP